MFQSQHGTMLSVYLQLLLIGCVVLCIEKICALFAYGNKVHELYRVIIHNTFGLNTLFISTIHERILWIFHNFFREEKKRKWKKIKTHIHTSPIFPTLSIHLLFHSFRLHTEREAIHSFTFISQSHSAAHTIVNISTHLRMCHIWCYTVYSTRYTRDLARIHWLKVIASHFLHFGYNQNKTKNEKCKNSKGISMRGEKSM